MDFDWPMALGSFLVAIVVGLTGMGGGALMTPMLVTFFGVSPLAAVSSDLAASAVMKPVGSAVHYREGTVDMRLVGWLCLGSVPAAFCGVLIPRALGDGEAVHDFIRLAMGIALLVAASGILVRAVLSRRSRPSEEDGDGRITVRPVPTVVVGAVGGLVVGITSVGSGSLIIVALLLLYPALKPNHLVGTDLLQAVPLVFAAALGHFFFGEFRLEVTAALLVGSIPGVYLGSKISSRAPAGLIRRLLVVVLVASALNMFGVGVVPLAWTIAAFAVAATGTWLVGRRKRDTVPTGLPDETGTSGKRSASGRSMAAPDR
ncbi:sulfite exporter TauE/SafE family protein [Actinomadura algeriensis]|uniref:Probable membrane transporter protein n=1 Tax=Actinomadura algeriensis TaxID=1679523 RepID=A0ABR9JU37_9ACTN|nr:sulfite exporter TauE/SafE family protein [Actinomadura algeriensis]MBE1534084.1 putative membrane protein YfcA [Actinomadura algeriensis]